MDELKIKDDYIKLGQALKLCGFVENGGMAKNEIISGLVKVNGTVEKQRGKKIVNGDIISYRDKTVKIVN